MTSRKKRSFPRISEKTPTLSSAASSAPARMCCAISPERQPERPIKPLAVLRQQVLVDAGPVVEALEVAGGDELDQVVVARVVRREQREVVVGVGRALRLPLEAAGGGDVDLAAEDGLEPFVAAGVVEGHCPEHVPVVGDGHGLHAEADALVDQLVEATGPVEEAAVLGVQVEVDEVRLSAHSHSIVDGGLLLTSYTTRLMPRTSFTIRLDIRATRSYGRRTQSAVMPSSDSTARRAIVYW